jgi:hypothetical protein
MSSTYAARRHQRPWSKQLGLAGRLNPQLGQHVQDSSTVASLLATRP